MLIKAFEGGYYIRLLKGEKVLESLVAFIKKKEIKSGSLAGIGAVEKTRIGYYDLAHKKYIEKLFKSESELVNLTGNVSYLEDEPIVHAHATISDTDCRAYAGHLFETTTAVTVEITLLTTSVEMKRRFDESIGLNLLDLENT